MEDKQKLYQIATKAIAFVIIPLVLCIILFSVLKSRYLSPSVPGETKLESFEIADNETFTAIAQHLEESGFIRSANALKTLSRLQGLDKGIGAGEYEISKGMSPLEILKKLVSGKTIQRKVTIPEGTSVFQIGALLEKAGIVKKTDFENLIKDQSMLIKAGVLGETFEGYLFPDTYLFSRPITAEKIIWKMLEEGENRWKQEYTDRADELQLTRHEILTLASIIEKEAGNKSEYRTISSVFHNRLKQKMKLQSDPTVIYGIKNFNGNITKEDLETPTTYNTYVINGLPPGPICNPSELAVKAALYPEDSQYLFFVADGTGKHVFSRTLDEHNKYVNIYQRNRRPDKPNVEQAPAIPNAVPSVAN